MSHPGFIPDLCPVFTIRSTVTLNKITVKEGRKKARKKESMKARKKQRKSIKKQKRKKVMDGCVGKRMGEKDKQMDGWMDKCM